MKSTDNKLLVKVGLEHGIFRSTQIQKRRSNQLSHEFDHTKQTLEKPEYIFIFLFTVSKLTKRHSMKEW